MTNTGRLLDSPWDSYNSSEISQQENEMPSHTRVSWDLTDLYSGIKDPKIDQGLADCLASAGSFAAKYKGRINSPDLTVDTLLSAIRDYEELATRMAKPSVYASLVFSADTSKPAHGALIQSVQERQSQISIELMFFELELMAVAPEVIDPLLNDDRLANYRHFIRHARMFRDHRLSEPEERIMEEKSNTGERAFERLFEESVSAIEFTVRVDGEEKVMTEPEVLALLRDPSRETRRAAAASLTEGLTRNGRLLTFIFNTLVLDKAINDRLRRYEYPEQARNISNELDRETVETVIETCVEHYPLVARYYRTKRDVLGYDKLTHYDRYAPLFESRKQYSFDEARQIVLTAFGRFSDVLEKAAEEFFEKRWIDAAPRKGKRGGAFCMSVTPDHHPYLFMSYLGRKDHIMTLGHELGHGVHARLAREQTYLNFHSALPVAELASTFGEMLVFEGLVAASSLEERLALYA